MQLTDTHCHLYLQEFADDLEDVIRRAMDAGVGKMVVPGIDLETSREAVRMAARFEGVYAAVGVHPNSASEWNEEVESELMELAGAEKVKAIGEIGLDYYWNKTPKDLQEHVFRQQLELAAKLDKPVIVHNREATEDILATLEEWTRNLNSDRGRLSENPGVLHSFSGNEGQSEIALTFGFLIGIAGPVTFKNAVELQRLVAQLPLEKMLIETDSPYLTPHPHRGKRNEPGMVGLVNGKISELKDQSEVHTADATYMNAKRLFRW